MRILLFLSDLMIPLLFFYIIGFGLLMKKDIYNDFVTGAFDGLKIVVKIMPTLIGLMTGVGILRASGFLDALASLLENLLKPTGFPSALVPLSIVKMFSSGAASSLLLDLYKQHGPASVFGGGAVKESSEVPVGKGRIVMVIVRRPFERTVLCQHIGAGDGFADELPAELVRDKHGR